MSDFPAIDGNALGGLCGVMIDPVTIPLLLGSVKWLASDERYEGDIEDIYETTQAFEQLARRLMAVTPDCEANLVSIPAATIQMYMGTVSPAGWLFCDGSLTSSDLYPELAAALGVSGAFYLPDLRNRFPMGAGAAALGSTGGEASHILTLNEIPSHLHNYTSSFELVPHRHDIPDHTHTQSAHDHTISVQTGSTSASGRVMTGNNAVGSETTRTTSSVAPLINAATEQQTELNAVQTVTFNGSTNNNGGGAAHNNIPPYLAVNFIIKT